MSPCVLSSCDWLELDGESCLNMKGIIIIVVIMIKHRVSMLFICLEMCLIYSHVIKIGLVITYRTCYEKRILLLLLLL